MGWNTSNCSESLAERHWATSQNQATEIYMSPPTLLTRSNEWLCQQGWGQPSLEKHTQPTPMFFLNYRLLNAALFPPGLQGTKDHILVHLPNPGLNPRALSAWLRVPCTMFLPRAEKQATLSAVPAGTTHWYLGLIWKQLPPTLYQLLSPYQFSRDSFYCTSRFPPA